MWVTMASPDKGAGL